MLAVPPRPAALRLPDHQGRGAVPGGVPGVRPPGGGRDRRRGHGIGRPYRGDRREPRLPCRASPLGRRLLGRPQRRDRVARGRWILCMDADERLCHPEALPPALLAAPPEVGGFFIERHDLVTHFEEGERDVYPIGILRPSATIRRSATRGSSTSGRTKPSIRAGFEVRSLATLKLIHLVSHLPQERFDGQAAAAISAFSIARWSGTRTEFLGPLLPGKNLVVPPPQGGGRARSSAASWKTLARRSPCARPRGACWRPC